MFIIAVIREKYQSITKYIGQSPSEGISLSLIKTVKKAEVNHLNYRTAPLGHILRQ